jgi:CRP-like cAMP-binding protein
VLYREGDPYRGVFLVVSGMLELRKGRALIRVLGPGTSIGELWQAEGEPHQYTLVATQHSHVLHAAHEDVMDGMHDFPEFGVAMVQELGHRVHELNGRVLELERLVARLHGALTAAGLEPPDPRQVEAPSRSERT